MAEQNSYFDGEINEFVDWVNGDNSAEGANATGRKPVSGGSIRQLLQEHLKKPVVLEYNSVAGKNRLFPSAYARDLYNSDPEKYANLLIAEFEAAAEYTIKLFTDANYANEVDASNVNLYIKLGDSTSDNNYFRKYFKVMKGEEEYTSNIYVQATVRNSSYKTASTGANFASGSQINLNLEPLLHEGTNTIEITIGAFIGTQIFQKTIRYTIHVIDLSISVSYDYNKSAGQNANNLIFKVYTKNTSDADVTTCYRIDQSIEGSNASVNSNQYTQYSPDITSLREGVHTLQVMSYIAVNNNNVSQFIYSNIVYIKFVKYSGQSTQHNIALACSIDDRTALLTEGETPTLYLTQYNEAQLSWALVTTSSSVLKNVTWKLQQLVEEAWNDVSVFDYTVGKETINKLTFTPTSYGNNYRLVGYIEEQQEIVFNVVIKSAKFQISETGNYNLKLENAMGYSNDNPQTRKWISNFNGNLIACLFNRERAQDAETPAFPWNSISGWGEKCLHISPGDYVYIPYRVFSHNNINAEITGATIEIEFEFKDVTDPNDEVIVIGGENGKSKIVFTPTSATLYSDNNTYLVRTNFKANERIKLAFVINPNADAGDDTSLAFIVNNGILERVNKYSNSFSATRGIKIGKAGAGAHIYIHKTRAYNTALSPDQLFCNYALDAKNTSEIILNNNILASGKIDYSSTLNKLPVIFITGRMQDIIGSTGKEMNLNVNLAKIDMSDTERNMYIRNCRIRKHGQSTLNYPIPSFKIWSNSTYNVNDALSPDNGRTFKAEMFGCNLDGNGNPSPNTDLTYYKGRYQMKDKAIPANKWILQANYADSSGVHNGGIMRLITEAFYNARVEVNGQKYYKLRTIPQLIASIPASREGLDEADFYATNADRNAYKLWLQNPNNKKTCMYEYNNNGNGTVKLWSDCNVGDFPYDKIRVSPDSFPCVVFYRETENDVPVFLGQYVFMDDKKSDYIYGQRSIYKVKGDPFCLTQTNADNDTKDNRLWNNDNVLRIEVVKINTDMVGYRSHSFNGKAFDDIVIIYKTDDDNNYIDKDGNIIQESELATKGVVVSQSPNWYNGFELIYPDPDDLKNPTPTGINEVSKPFIDWHAWLTSTYEYWLQHGGTQDKLYNGANYNPAHAGFAKFREEAEEHLNLYLLAGFYICFIRLGLVDTPERNAQPKTYDGQHFHYEPWDMDIALGNQNTGGIKWNPPMNRATNDGSVAAFSGTHISNGVIDSSNWLWDALESWPYWQDIVRRVADALSTTLSYDNICKVLDEEYAAKWCERIYNISGHFKYIETKGANMYNWLQGARTSHRHWWLKTSMDYWDARWTCGDFKNTGAYMNIKYNGGGSRALQIKIKAATKGYFCYAEEVGGNPVINSSSLVEIAGGQRGVITVPASVNLEAKSPFYIYGCPNIRELDLSDIYNEPSGTGGVRNLYLEKFIDAVNGVSLKVLNIGVPLDLLAQGVTNTENIVATNGLPDVIRNLEELNIQGCMNNGGGDSSASTVNYSSFLDNTEHLKRLYAIGTDLESFTSNNYQEGTNARQFKGGHYDTLQLPDTIKALEFHDSSWGEYNNESDPADATGLSFWHYDKQTGEITNVSFADSDVTSLKMYGTTLQNDCAINLLMAFIAKATASGEPEKYTLYFEGLNMNAAFYQAHPLFTFTYTDLIYLSAMNAGHNNGYDGNGDSISQNFKGYIRLSDIETDDSSVISERIQIIQTKFGENVFTKSAYNDNLVVDFQIGDEDEMFLTVSSYRGNCYDATTNTVSEGYVNDITPNALIVRASKFLLPDTPRNQELRIVDGGNLRTEYLGATVGATEDLTLLVPEMKRLQDRTQPSTLTLQVTDSSEGESIVKTATVNVRHKVYPTAINIDILNANGQHCSQNRRGSVIDAHLNTATGTIVMQLVYPDGTAEADKATITGVVFAGDDNNENFTITQDENNIYRASLSYSLNLSDVAVPEKLSCRIVYKSGDTLDALTVNLTVGNDDVLIDSQSNPALYALLDYMNIPSMSDDVTGKLFTKRSLQTITAIEFEDSDSTSELYDLLSDVDSFLVDTSDATKGTLFDYISSATTVININGCTNAALEASELVIDATRFTTLTSFSSTSDAKVGFVYSPQGVNQTLTEISIYNACRLQIKNLTYLTALDVRNATYVDIHNVPNVTYANFYLDVDNSNLTHLVLDGVIAAYGADILAYINDYIGNGNLPAEIVMSVTWTNTPTVNIALLKNIARYIAAYQDATKLALNGVVNLNNYYASVRSTIETYYPNLVGSWGDKAIELVPTSLNSYITGRLNGAVITASALASLQADCLVSYKTYTDNNNLSADRALLTNALWLRNTEGTVIGQSQNLASWFPNMRYVGWPRITQGTDFELGRYSKLKAEIIVTNTTRPPYNGNPGVDDLDIMYKMIVIPYNNLNGWYSKLADWGLVTSGATTDADKVAALAAIDIYCKDVNGNSYAENYLINTIDESELDALEAANTPSGHKLSVRGNDTAALSSYTF